MKINKATKPSSMILSSTFLRMFSFGKSIVDNLPHMRRRAYVRGWIELNEISKKYFYFLTDIKILDVQKNYIWRQVYK